MSKLPVVEIFHSIQGEGMYTGSPSIFVRVTGCNLRCVFGNSICDTSYTSFNPEKSKYNSIDDVVREIEVIKEQYPNTNDLVITGGEPMLYKEGVKELLSKLSQYGFRTTMETNGTLGDLEYDNHESNTWINLYSVSPKLSTSVDKYCKFIGSELRDRHDKTRINYSKLSRYCMVSNWSEDISVQFKFVYTDEESVSEIKTILNVLENEYDCDLDNVKILLMPEGTTKEQLDVSSQKCVEVCLREGWTFCDRLHIRIWDDKKCV
jgi:7-carboxy-7-deazaguanine synthase